MATDDATSLATTSLNSEAMLCFHHKFIAKDNMSITVHIHQAVGNMEEFFHYPQEYLRVVSFMHHTVHAFNGLPHMNVGVIKSCMFSLIHHLKPDSSDASYSASKCARKTAKNISEAMCLSGYGQIEQLTSPFYTLCGKSLGFSMMSSFHHLTFW